MSETTTEMTFWEHLSQLRIRFIRCLIYILLGSIAGFFVANPVLSLITRPLARATVPMREKPLRILVDKTGRMSIPDDVRLAERKNLSRFQVEFEFESGDPKISFGPDYRTNFYYFDPLDPFLLWFKASFIVGIILAIPFILMEVWYFVTPGMNDREKGVIKPIIAGGVFLFPLGVAFAYFILSYALGFLTSYAFPGLEPRLGIMSYLNLALTMMIGSGIVFELPVVIVVLSWMGIVHSSFLRKYRRHAIVVLFIIAAIVTPTTDIFTMTIVALPLLFLYEVSIVLSVIIEKRSARAHEGE